MDALYLTLRTEPETENYCLRTGGCYLRTEDHYLRNDNCYLRIEDLYLTSDPDDQPSGPPYLWDTRGGDLEGAIPINISSGAIGSSLVCM